MSVDDINVPGGSENTYSPIKGEGDGQWRAILKCLLDSKLKRNFLFYATAVTPAVTPYLS
jgi:hypothetical protein